MRAPLPACRAGLPALLRLWPVLLLLVLPRNGALAKPPPQDNPPWSTLLKALDQSVRSTLAPGSSWGVEVAHADSGTVWFATNATRLFVPASNTKLFSVALALHHFGPDRRFNTRLLLAGLPDSAGAVNEPLWIAGGGSPFNLSSNSAVTFAPVIDILKQRGIRRLDGGIVLDDSALRCAPYGDGWNWDDLQEGYGAPVSAFVLNDNTARVMISGGAHPGQPAAVRLDPDLPIFDLENAVRTTGATERPHLTFKRLPGESRLLISGSVPAGGKVVERLAVPDAVRAFGLTLSNALTGAGILVKTGVRPASGGESPPRKVMGIVSSYSVQELAPECLKPSNNLLAQLLLVQVGADTRSQEPAPGSFLETDDSGHGVAALNAFLKSIGVGGDQAFFEEGSGLSRKNLVTPEAVVRLLRHVKKQPWGNPFIAALPVGGVDGTLATRFQEPPARGNVHAKTGSLRHVSALSGFVTTASGQPLVFAIFVNGYQSATDGASARAEIDHLVETLAAFTGRGPD